MTAVGAKQVDHSAGYGLLAQVPHNNQHLALTTEEEEEVGFGSKIGELDSFPLLSSSDFCS